jgi:hypothetical protein
MGSAHATIRSPRVSTLWESSGMAAALHAQQIKLKPPPWQSLTTSRALLRRHGDDLIKSENERDAMDCVLSPLWQEELA